MTKKDGTQPEIDLAPAYVDPMQAEVWSSSIVPKMFDSEWGPLLSRLSLVGDKGKIYSAIVKKIKPVLRHQPLVYGEISIKDLPTIKGNLLAKFLGTTRVKAAIIKESTNSIVILHSSFKSRKRNGDKEPGNEVRRYVTLTYNNKTHLRSIGVIEEDRSYKGHLAVRSTEISEVVDLTGTRQKSEAIPEWSLTDLEVIFQRTPFTDWFIQSDDRLFHKNGHQSVTGNDQIELPQWRVFGRKVLNDELVVFDRRVYLAQSPSEFAWEDPLKYTELLSTSSTVANGVIGDNGIVTSEDIGFTEYMLTNMKIDHSV